MGYSIAEFPVDVCDSIKVAVEPQQQPLLRHQRATMSMERSNDDPVTIEVPSTSTGSSSRSMGWEDIAIVIQDMPYSINDHTQLNTTDAIESSCQPQPPQHIDCCTFEKADHPPINSKDDVTFKNDAAIPSPIPVGSSDDSWCSDSTESSNSISKGIDNHSDSSKDDDIEEATTDEVLSLSIPPEQNDATRVSSEVVAPESIHHDTRSTKPKLKFPTVQVREYAAMLGDHPYCDMYPLSLDWKYVQVLTTTTDDFEENHRRRIPNEIKVFSPVVARKNLRKGRGMNNHSNNNNKTVMVNVRARKLSVMERMSLLIEFTGYTSQQLYHLERKRQLMAQDEKFMIGSTEALTEI